MQTFVPYADFAASAEVLDQKRLGKQRVECIQVVRAITVPDYGWRHHPAATMWRGWLEALGRYSLTVCEVWVERGFADTCAETLRADLADAGLSTIRSQSELAAAGELPRWLGDEALHESHRSNLKAKDPAFYGEVFAQTPDGLPYVWPPGRDAAEEA